MLTTLLSILVPPFSLAKLLADAAELTGDSPSYSLATGALERRAGGGFGWGALSAHRVNRVTTSTRSSAADTDAVVTVHALVFVVVVVVVVAVLVAVVAVMVVVVARSFLDERWRQMAYVLAKIGAYLVATWICHRRGYFWKI